MGIKYNIDLPLDAPERTILHRQIISRKRFLRELYSKWYRSMAEEINLLPEGILVELGSGGGFFKEFAPRVVCSDILDLPGNDMCFSALEMPFEDNSVSGIFMIDTFHHIPDSEKFLLEANRVLKKNGMIMMIEPANSWWGRFIYRNFHHEPFEPSRGWDFPLSGPMSGANGALPWIVFKRDADRLKDEFPAFELKKISYHTPFIYLISGGVSYRQLLPNFSYGFIHLLDRVISKIFPSVSMFMTIRVIKH